MRITKSIIASSLVLALWAGGSSCSDHEAGIVPEERTDRMTFDALHPATLSAGVPSAQPTAQTRATDTGFETADRIGLYITEAGTPLQISGNYVNNPPLTYDGSTWSTASPIYWDGGTYDVYAYYPYLASPASIDECPFAVQTDQSTPRNGDEPGGYEASDILWTKQSGVTAGDGPIALPFSHMLSRLVVWLVPGEDYEGELPDEDKIEVFVHTTVPEATIDFTSGFITRHPFGTPKTIKAKPIGNHRYAAIVVPQRIDRTQPFVEAVMSGVSYLSENTFVYKKGIQHTVIMPISKNPDQIKIEIGGEIGDWN